MERVGLSNLTLALTPTLTLALALALALTLTRALALCSQAALPFGTIVVIMCIWALVTLPLTVAGGIIGRKTASGREFTPPCRVNKIPREIPPIPWYRQGTCQVRA